MTAAKKKQIANLCAYAGGILLGLIVAVGVPAKSLAEATMNGAKAGAAGALLGLLIAKIALAFVKTTPEEGAANNAAPDLPLRLRYPVVLVLGILLPGMASLMLRGWREVGPRSVALLVAIPMAFLIFGPLWGDVLFSASTQEVQRLGKWPFIATCIVVPIVSLVYAVQDRQVAVRSYG